MKRKFLAFILGALLVASPVGAQQYFTQGSAVSVSNLVSSKYPFNDAFNRADSTSGTISAAPTGQTYSVTGADASFVQIQTKQVVDLQTSSSTVAYFSPGNLAGNVVQIGVSATFYSQTGGSGSPSFTLIASEDSTISLSHMVHTIVGLTPITTTWNGGAQNIAPTGGCQTQWNPANGGAAQNGGKALTAFVAGETLTAVKSVVGNTMHLYVYTSTGEGYTQDCSSLAADGLIGTLWGSGVGTEPIAEFSMGSTLAPAFTRFWAQTSNGTVTFGNPSGASIVGNSNLQVPGGIDNTVIGANSPGPVFASKVGIGEVNVPSSVGLYVHQPTTTTNSGNVIIDNSGDTGSTRPEIVMQTTNSSTFLGGIGYRGATSGAMGAENYVDNVKEFHWLTNATDRMQAGQPGGSSAGFVFRLTPVTIASGASGLATCASGLEGSIAIVKDSDSACSFGVAPTHSACVVGTNCYACMVVCAEANGVYGWASF